MGVTGNELYVVDEAIYVIEKKKIKGRLTISDTGFIFTGKEGTSGQFDICAMHASQTVLPVPGFFGTKNKPALRLSMPGELDGIFAMSEEKITQAIKAIEDAAFQEDHRRKEKQYETACQRMREISTSVEAAAVGNEFKRIPAYKDADQKAEECRIIEKKLQNKEQLYDSAAQLLKSLDLVSIDKAISLFEELDDYRDSSSQLSFAIGKRSKIVEAIYQQAQEKINVGKSSSECEEASKLLVSIPGYRDADALLETCNAKLKLLKEKEERERKEAAERAAIEDTEKKITSINRKALGFFLDNPYRVLGVPRHATTEEAQTVLDKFKKLERLKALASYSSPYHLKNFKKPDRQTSVVQAAIGQIGKGEEQVFAFETATGCASWDLGDSKRAGQEYDEYDVFLGQYLFALLNDPSFEKAKIWRPVIQQIDKYLQNATMVTKAVGSVADDFAEAFGRQILKPINSLLENASVDATQRLYDLIARNSDKFNSLKEKLGRSVLKYMRSLREKMDEALPKFKDEEHPTTREQSCFASVLRDFYAAADPVIAWAKNSMGSASVRYTMICEAYADTAWRMMVLYHNANHKPTALKIAKNIYQYCNDDGKRRIRNTFGVEDNPLWQNDLTSAEMDLIGDAYMKGTDLYPKSEAKAVSWYRKAVDNGNSDSMLTLALMYIVGDCSQVSRNVYEGFRMCQRAVNAGNNHARVFLGQMYRDGIGTSKDVGRAFEIWKEAAQNGDPDALERLKKLVDQAQNRPWEL